MKSLFTFSILTLALLGLSSFASMSAAPGQLILIDKDVKPHIVVSPQGTASEKFAAQELAVYLQKMSGQIIGVEETVTIPTTQPVIIVGHHPANTNLNPDELGVEESIIDVSAQNIRIVGGKLPSVKLPNGMWQVQDRGTLYGVYEFLDSLGVRWYRPEEWGEFVPQKPVINLPYGQSRSKPAYGIRMGTLGSYRYWQESTKEQNRLLRLWAVRNRENTLNSLPAEYGGFRTIQIRHIYNTLFPPKDYFQTHPEFYALIDGTRREDGQLCLGNKQVQELIVQKLVKFARENPEYETLSLEPNDNEKWCQCNLCTELDDPEQKNDLGEVDLGPNRTYVQSMGNISMGNRVTAFGAIVAEKFAEHNKTTKLIWLAYSAHTEPPSRIKKLPENIITMPAAFSSAFSDPQLAYSDYSRDLFDPLSKPNQNFVRVLEGYGKMSRLLTYEYWSGIAWVGPMPLIYTMQDRLQSYRKYPIDGVYNETHPHWGPQGIDLYFYSKLMWNPDLDVTKELELYCQNYYGPAAAPMLEYHQLLEKAGRSGIPHYAYGVKTHQIFTPQVVARMGELIEESKLLINDQQPYAQRFKGVWAGYEYTRLVMPYFDELRKGNKLEAAKHWERANKLILSYKDGDVFDNGVLFGSLQFFGNYNLNIPQDIQKQARALVAEEA